MPQEHDNGKKPRGIKSIDMIVTSIILGGVVASAYGIHRHVKNKHGESEGFSEDPAFTPENPEKPGFWSRLFHKKKYT